MIQETSILRLALPTPLRRLFDYLPPQDIDTSTLIPGIRVKVPFQSRTMIGVLISIEKNADVPYAKLKKATEVLDSGQIMTSDIVKLCKWAADYYHHSLGEVMTGALPVLLRKGSPQTLTIKRQSKKAVASEVVAESAPMAPSLALNKHQQIAVDAICQDTEHFHTFLLEGVTGSGKTEVYLRAIQHVLDQGRQALVLIPEISLTPQTIARFEKRFPVKVVALHSGLSDKQRLDGWLFAKSGAAKIIIGTRSAIFTPLLNPGLIIVDEEHDQSFKQQDRLRYHARDLAILRASILNIPIILGSATPSLETLLNAERGRYTYLSLPERAGGASMPTYRVIDLKSSPANEGLSDILLAAIRKHLNQGNQVMLFLNRRGFAPILYCTQCTWMSECKRCDAKMVYHHRPPRLQCHHCDARNRVPAQCEACGQTTLHPVGLGTQKLEESLSTLFPHIDIIRVDRDSTRLKGSMQKLLDKVNEDKPAILMGTQMLAKGHHFPQVTLVGILDIDGGLFSADFRAAEQMGQLLMQVSGRAGREEKPGTVMLQTNHPDHPLIQTLIKQGYQTFAKQLLTEREEADLPPYSHFAIFRAEAYEDRKAIDFLDKVRELGVHLAGLQVLGPAPAIMQRKKGLHCQHLLLKTKKRSHLQHALKILLEKIDNMKLSRSVKWVLDVDPIEV